MGTDASAAPGAGASKPHTLVSARSSPTDFVKWSSSHRPEYGRDGAYVIVAPVDAEAQPVGPPPGLCRAQAGHRPACGRGAGPPRPGVTGYPRCMRIATWNVNSLKARMDAVERWLERAQPDVLLMQETKLSDEDAPLMPFQLAGYDLLHHGEGRWNGVAIASRVGISDPVTNFGDGPVRDSRSGASVGVSEEDFDPLDEARMVSAVCGGIRVVSIYAPNGRVVDSPFYLGKLRWFERLTAWAADGGGTPACALVIGGDYNVAPTDDDVWSPRRGARRHPCLGSRSGRRWRGLRDVGPHATRTAQRETGPRALLVVGLPGGHVPQEPGHAHRPAVCHGPGGRSGRLGRDRPRGAQGTAHTVGPRAGGHRPGCAGRPFDAGWEAAMSRVAARTRPTA